MNLTSKISEYSPYIPISINKEATDYFQREPCWNVICKYCKRENPGKNKNNPWGTVRQDNLISYPKACPKCHKGGLPKLDLKPGLIYNNCMLIEKTNTYLPKNGEGWFVKDLETNEIFIRYSYRLRARETWHR
jgi:hypothetical protein